MELEMYARQFQGHAQPDPRHHMNTHHMNNPEAMLMHASRQMQVGPNDFNNSMSARMSQPPPMQHQPLPHGLPDWDESNMSFVDSSSMAVDGGPVAHGMKKVPRKDKKRRSTANSDGELRELFEANRGRSLEDVSNELRGNERGPKAERKRQLYAMLW
jgi:regulatory factor X